MQARARWVEHADDRKRPQQGTAVDEEQDDHHDHQRGEQEPGLEAGHGLSGSPLRVDLTPGERSEVGRLLGMSWERSERAVGAKATAMADESYGATVTDLLAVTGDPVRDLRAAKESARQNAATERERTAAALCDVGVPATTDSAWLDRRGLPAAVNGQLLDPAGRCARVWSALP